MKKFIKISVLALFVAFGAFAVTNLSPTTAIAQDSQEAPAEEQSQTEQQQEEQPQEESQESRYNYIAQPGDSYTKIARKAVQIYGYYENVSLSLAEIIAAETFLTSEAGFPLLNLGQEVILSEDAVKSAVEKAQNLDESAKARWERYVPYVDFNTDNVGESR